MMNKPEILSVNTIAKTRIFEVESVDLKFSNGVKRTYERLKPRGRAAVLVIPVENNELLMVREYAVGTERYELGFPKGLIDPGEEPIESVERELKEEIGLGANHIVHLRTVISAPSHMNSPMHIFLAQDFYPCKLEGDEPEPLQLVRVPLSEIDNLLADPEFNEARNLTALYCLRDYLNSQRLKSE